MTEQATTHIPARDIPIPAHLSEEAQGVLAMPAQAPAAPWPDDLTDKAAVAATIAAQNAPAAEAPAILAAGTFGAALQDVDDVAVEHRMFGDISVYIATPPGVADDDPRLFVVFHGAWITGGGILSQIGSQLTAKSLGVRTWAVDYRMPPYHPFPTPLDDCVGAYREALKVYSPENIAIGGTSGGGNLTLAVLLRARDEGMPMPAAAAINTPYADMTHAGDSHHTNLGIDPGYTIDQLANVREVYRDGHDKLDPLISPVLGDYAGLPPTILSTGTRDFLLSDTVRVHRKFRALGIEAELHVWEAAPHFMFLGLSPEDHERNAEIKSFLDRHWGTPAPAITATPAAATESTAELASAGSTSAFDRVIGTWDLTQTTPRGTQSSVITFREESGALVADVPDDEYGTTVSDARLNGDTLVFKSTIRKPIKLSITSTLTLTGDRLEGQAKGMMGPAIPMVGTRRA